MGFNSKYRTYAPKVLFVLGLANIVGGAYLAAKGELDGLYFVGFGAIGCVIARVSKHVDRVHATAQKISDNFSDVARCASDLQHLINEPNGAPALKEQAIELEYNPQTDSYQMQH